jgi:hypothetical protein
VCAANHSWKRRDTAYVIWLAFLYSSTRRLASQAEYEDHIAKADELDHYAQEISELDVLSSGAR